MWFLFFWIALVSFYSDICQIFNLEFIQRIQRLTASWLAVSLWIQNGVIFVEIDQLNRSRTPRSITFTKDNYFHALTVSFSKKNSSFWILGDAFFWDTRKTNLNLGKFGNFILRLVQYYENLNCRQFWDGCTLLTEAKTDFMII